MHLQPTCTSRSRAGSESILKKRVVTDFNNPPHQRSRWPSGCAGATVRRRGAAGVCDRREGKLRLRGYPPGAAWKSIPVGTAALSERVAAFRRGLDVEALREYAEGGKPVLFDLGLANDLYAALIGPVEEVIKDARHLASGPADHAAISPAHDREASHCNSAAQGHLLVPGRRLAHQTPGSERSSLAREPQQGPAPSGAPGPEHQAGGVCRSAVRSGRAGEGAGRTARTDSRRRHEGLQRLLAGRQHRPGQARPVCHRCSTPLTNSRRWPASSVPRRRPPRQRRQRNRGEADGAGRLPVSISRPIVSSPRTSRGFPNRHLRSRCRSSRPSLMMGC